MRAREFVLETKRGKLTKRQRNASRGINKFTDGEHWNSDYKAYRLGLALACTDGKSMPEVDFESWVGRWKTAHPYTPEEQEMLNRAYNAVKVDHEDLNHGDMRSQELDTTNKVSPVSNWMKTK